MIPTLPKRVPGATLAARPARPAPENCAACRNGQACDWHWSRQHLAAGECQCCAGLYSTCRNQETI